MDGRMKIDLDKLPIKRLAAIEESGTEHFPPETDYEEKRLDAVRRIDFSWVLERDAKKPKNSKEPAPPAPVWPWQGLVENLRTAHEELSVILDLINTVEANDAVTVAGMQRPKQLPNEVLSDLAVSAATKLQRLRHLGRYFKQSSKALEQQVAREAIFYGSLIRLQQNWKIKRQRVAVTGPGSEGFSVDLLDNSKSDLLAFSRLSPLSTVRVEKDSAGVLAVQLPLKLCRSLCLKFLGAHPTRNFIKRKTFESGDHSREPKKEALSDEDINECVKESHSILREIHQSIFQEQVFDMVNNETCNPSPGVNVTGIREDFLQLAIGQDTSVCLCLVPSGREVSHKVDSTSQVRHEESGLLHLDSRGPTLIDEKHDPFKRNFIGRPNPVSLEIYLQSIFHEKALVRGRGKQPTPTRLQVFSQPSTECGLLGHFCMTIAHRVFSSRVLSLLEQLVSRVSYLHLLSRPTWHSRTSAWSLSLKVPCSILRAGARVKPLGSHDIKSGCRTQFYTKVAVNDDRISVSGEGAPSILGSFRGGSTDVCSINSYGCVLEDLPMIILQQVASQVIHWLYEEAMLVGLNVIKDFLGIYFELDRGETLGLVAHVDPDGADGCITWWFVMDADSVAEDKLSGDHREPDNKTFLGNLSLGNLYSIMMDLVPMCTTGGSQ